MNTYWMAGLAVTTVVTLSQAMAGEVERELDVPSDAKVVIQNRAGEVRVETWDRPTVWFHAEHEDGCTGVDSKSEGGVVRIDVLVKEQKGGSNIRAELQVKLPVGCDLTVETLSADVQVSHPQGSLDVDTASGEIKAEFTGQRLKLESVSGEILASGTAELAELQTASGDIEANLTARSLRAESVSGDVELDGEQERVTVSTTSGEVKHQGGVAQLQIGSVSGEIYVARVTGSAELTTSSGDIVAAGKDLKELRAESVGGDINFTGTLASDCNLTVSSKGGDVRLALPPDTPARYELSSFSGEIGGLNGATSEEGAGPGRKLEYYSAAATAQVTASTFSGDIHIEPYTPSE